jgi:hypothetical protein
VTATIDGQVVSWINTYTGETAAADVGAASAAETTSSQTSTYVAASKTKTTSAATSTSTAVTGDYQRIAYYNAEDGTADGLTFLGNHGGSESGVFD